jgi:uncharacterized protein
MLKVVSNTTPLLALLKIKKLHLLHQIYNTIYVSGAVYKEIENGATKQFYCDLKTISWIKIEAIKDRGAKNYFLDLDEGEAETIILASELPADIVILDEIMGRRHAKRSGLTITGTIGVLIKAKELKLIENVIPLLTQMKENGVWISSKLIDSIKERVNE